MRFYSDLIRGKVVVLSFFFTSCVNVCITQGANLERLQALLPDRIGKEVFFISVSRDPATDTPARLRRWGRTFGVGRGWVLVTGDKSKVDQLVSDLSSESADRGDHSPFLLIGNDMTGVWTLGYGFADPADLLRAINKVAGFPEK